MSKWMAAVLLTTCAAAVLGCRGRSKPAVKLSLPGFVTKFDYRPEDSEHTDYWVWEDGSVCAEIQVVDDSKFPSYVSYRVTENVASNAPTVFTSEATAKTSVEAHCKESWLLRH